MKILYFTYDGILDPLGQSQITPYINFLSLHNHNFFVLSYEKSIIKNIAINSTFYTFSNWKKIKFYRGFFGKILNVFLGIIYLIKISKKFKPDIIHLRGYIPGLIFFLSFLKIKIIYDFRSFAVGEHVDIGNIKNNSVIHRFFQFVDKKLIKKSSGIIVLEEYAKNLLFKEYSVPKVPLKVIRTCTDTKKFLIKDNYFYNKKKIVKFVSLGGAKNPYRSDLIIKVVKDLLDANIKCTIDFINKDDQKIILSYAKKISFPIDKIKIYYLDHKEITHHLNKFDFGMIFYDTSYWRKVCSPTKLGEFLAAGLPVISLKGIDVIDYFTIQYNFFLNLRKNEILNDKQYLKNLIEFISMKHNNKNCQKLALKEFDISIGNLSYKKLYDEIQ